MEARSAGTLVCGASLSLQREQNDLPWKTIESKGRGRARAFYQSSGPVVWAREKNGEEAMMSDNRKIGTGLLALGGLFIFFGVLLLFEPGLLAMGENEGKYAT